MKHIFRCFLFQTRPAPELSRGRRAAFWAWNWGMVLLAALGLGLVSLALAPANYGWNVFWDYFSSPVLLALNLLPSRMMKFENIFCPAPYDFFGTVLPQYVVFPAAAILFSLPLAALAMRAYRRHQG